MKRNMVLLLVVVALMVGTLYTVGDTTRYERKAVVVDVSFENVLAEDATGNVWGFTVNELLPCGTTVTLLMDTKGTEHNIYDDEVVGYTVTERK